MSEKVVLTREQADEVELQKKDFNEFSDIITRRILTSDINNYYNSTFHSISVDELIRALYIGYEVERNFKVGDWVRINWSSSSPSIRKIIDIDMEFGVITIDGDQANINPSLQLLSLASPEEIEQEKERRWWGKYNRETREIREGDLLVDSQYNFDEVFQVDSEEVFLAKRGPVSIENIKENYLIACFDEDRRDISR